MTTFPTLVYKDGGNCQRPGGTFSWQGAADQAAFDVLIAQGWSPTFAEAVNAPTQKQAVVKDNKPQDEGGEEGIDTVSPPTREELVAKAEELDLKFNYNLGDKKLLALIEGALAK